ncbi:unnamed protein product [Rhizophagus irregularis]|nr:unnamed protein product [Rhizophagus irregularis]
MQSQSEKIIYEWIPYYQFNKINRISKYGPNSTIYSAEWKDGPLKLQNYHNNNIGIKNYVRESNKVIILRKLHNSKNITNDLLMYEVDKYSTSGFFDDTIYGISQYPNTKDYILVLNYLCIKNHCVKCVELCTANYYGWCKPCVIKYLKENFMNWTSRNEKVDNFIQDIQLKINNCKDIIFEWIPYNQFNKIVEINKSVYLAIWKDGPLYWDIYNNEYNRKSDKEIALICFNLHDLQNNIDNLNKIIAKCEYDVTLICLNNSQKFLDKAKEIDRLLNKVKEIITNGLKIYGISQNPDKKDYILVIQNEYCIEYGKIYCKNWCEKYTHMWCKQCQLKYLKEYFINCTSENEKLDYLIQEMQSKINSCFNIVFEWIPYNQFNYVKEIVLRKKCIQRVSNKKIALKSINDSQIITDKFLNEVKEYSINKMNDILNVYGISQDPNTKNYIIVLEFAEGGSYNYWMNKNYKDFDWKNKIQTLLSIIEGLKGIHQKQKVHHDLHPGNILFLTKNLNSFNKKSLFISDMGLCEDVNNTSEVKIYGVIPYMAPEVLRNKTYTQAADIYSFGMIMYFTATGKQPFVNRAHDHNLVLDICNGIRPEINEPGAPKCYIDLMRRCWDSDPSNRPSAIEIHKLIKSFCKFYISYKMGGSNEVEIKNQIKEAENYRKLYHSLKKNKQHPQAIYTSRLLNPYTAELQEYDNSECLDCEIIY